MATSIARIILMLLAIALFLPALLLGPCGLVIPGALFFMALLLSDPS